MAAEAHPTTGPTPDSGTNQDRRAALWQLICAAAIAAVAGWGLLQTGAVNEWFEIPEELQKIYQPNHEQALRIVAATRVAEYENSSLVMGILGALAGGFLGVVSVLPARSAVKAAFGLLAGIICGAALGAAGGSLGIVVGERLTGGWPVEDILPASAMHAVFWAFAGCGVGLAVGLPSRSAGFTGRAVLAGAGAGLIAGFLYVPLASYFFPVFNSERPIPDGQWNRLFWIALPTILIAIAVGRASGKARAASTSDR